MALTRILIPLALVSLLVVITSAIQNPNNIDNPQQQLLDHGLDYQQDDNDLLGSTLNNLGVDQLLGNLLDNKQDQNENNKPQGQANFIPKDPSDEEKTKPYEGQEHMVPTKPYYGQEQKTNDQAHDDGIYSDINHIAIQGFVLCESEANKFYPLKGKYPSSEVPMVSNIYMMMIYSQDYVFVLNFRFGRLVITFFFSFHFFFLFFPCT